MEGADLSSDEAVDEEEEAPSGARNALALWSKKPEIRKIVLKATACFGEMDWNNDALYDPVPETQRHGICCQPTRPAPLAGPLLMHSSASPLRQRKMAAGRAGRAEMEERREGGEQRRKRGSAGFLR